MNHQLTYSLDQLTSSCLVIGLCTETLVTALPLKNPSHTLIAHLKNKLKEAGDSLYRAGQDEPDLLLIHCGDQTSYNNESLTRTVQKIALTLCAQRVTSATIVLPQLANQKADWQIEQMILQFEAQCYQFLDLKTKKNDPHALTNLHWYLPAASDTAPKKAQTIAECIRFTRNLANLPANICTPSYLAKQAQLLDVEWDTVSTKVMDKHAIEALQMGAFLAVARGSAEAPQFIQLKYSGAPAAEAPILLIGKGITFDSGGISLKPPEHMEEMKFDMAGAATVLGVIKACAILKLPLNVVGLMACTENMPSGSATKPGDVVKSMSGQTIEIINTDAEGRLVLADALTYGKQFKPRFVIDIATLTGAVIIALGNVSTGLMTNDEELGQLLLTAAAQSQDKAWRLPMEDAYQSMLDSPIADMVNSTAERVAGSVTAACFLSRFAQSFRWAHLDVAGTAWVSGKNRCATGRPVGLLIQFLTNLINDAN